MARFDRLTVLNTIIADGLVPLFYHPDVEVARQVAAALAAGGSRLLEFTNRGDFAADVFAELVKYCNDEHSEFIVGVGSIDDAPTAALYLARGANFVVGPNFNRDVARLCNRRKIAYLPGCSTVTEIATAEEWGSEIVKLFPGSLGGPSYVKAVLAPRPWSRIMPTGGVKLEEGSLQTWFDAGVVCVGGGSDLVRKNWIEDSNFSAIEKQTRTALDLIRGIRGSR